jgi:hypothetical protein
MCLDYGFKEATDLLYGNVSLCITSFETITGFGHFIGQHNKR